MPNRNGIQTGEEKGPGGAGQTRLPREGQRKLAGGERRRRAATGFKSERNSHPGRGAGRIHAFLDPCRGRTSFSIRIPVAARLRRSPPANVQTRLRRFVSFPRLRRSRLARKGKPEQAESAPPVHSNDIAIRLGGTINEIG